MRKKYFLSALQIKQIINHYGGLRKYKLNKRITPEYSRIYYCEKVDRHKWLSIVSNNSKSIIMVTLTNDVGLIIQRDFWYIEDNLCHIQSEEKIEVN